MKRPKITLNLAMTLDGCIDDSSEKRLVHISSPQDYAYREKLRSEHDAILIGANTVRKDHPRCVILDEKLRKKQPNFTKITLTRSGNLDPDNTFFTYDDTPTWIYSKEDLRKPFPSHVDIRSGYDSIETILESIAESGIQKLMIEGGSEVLHTCISRNLYDTLRVVVAPFVLGDPEAIRAFQHGSYTLGEDVRLELSDVQTLGDCAALIYKNPYAQ